MKNLLSIVLALFTCISLFGQNPTNGNEAYKEITSIQRIMIQASEEVLEAENNLDMEIVHLEVDLLFGSKVKYIYRTLSSGWLYLAYAEGENVMVKDLDMEMSRQDPQTGEWSVVMTDTKEKFGALCAAEVTETARYRFGVKVASYVEGFSACHYYILIAHQKPK